MNSHGTDRYTPWFLMLAFALPIALAYLFLTLDWYRGGATNRGQLLMDVSYQSLKQTNPAERQWQIITFLPERCDTHCQDRLTTLRQAHIALGREQDRVVPLVFTQGTSDPDWQNQLSDQSFQLADANQAVIEQFNGVALAIVDPLGQWVMTYPLVDSQEDQIQQGRDLLADLRKLLKLSRIG